MHEPSVKHHIEIEVVAIAFPRLITARSGLPPRSNGRTLRKRQGDGDCFGSLVVLCNPTLFGPGEAFQQEISLKAPIGVQVGSSRQIAIY